MKCLITGFLAFQRPVTGDYHRIESDALGGVYEISGSAAAELLHWGEKGKRLLATWVLDQRLAGILIPHITTMTLERVDGARPLTLVSRMDRLYRFLEDQLRSIGEALPWQVPSYLNSNDLAAITPEFNQMKVRVWTESTSAADVDKLVEYGITKGFLAVENYGLSLTIDGWQHLEALNAVGASSTQAFVAMWFGAEVGAAYDEAIAPAIQDSGYRPMRIDRKEHNNRIDDEIIAEIRRSRFVVADFTCGMVEVGGQPKAIPRGGVYYEAGFAQGLGIPVIWMVRSDHIDHVHFDTRQFNHITWDSPEDLRVKLRNRIGAVLGDGPEQNPTVAD